MKNSLHCFCFNHLNNFFFVKAYVRHPELSAARENRDYACKQMCDAVNMISDVAQAAGVSDVHPYERQGELAAALNELDVNIICCYFIYFLFLTMDRNN